MKVTLFGKRRCVFWLPPELDDAITQRVIDLQQAGRDVTGSDVVVTAVRKHLTGTAPPPPAF